MKQRLVTAFGIGFLVSLGWAEEGQGLKLDDETDRINYGVGYQIGGDFKRQGVELNTDALVRGIQDAIEGREPPMGRQEMNQTLRDFKRRIMVAERERLKQQTQKNFEEGQAFLAENAKREGVKVLPSGVQYKVIQEGTGRSPDTDDTVTVHYRGTLLDGTEFDSSYQRGKPTTFRVNRVIPGWTAALPKMQEGAKWQLFIPSQLAYGPKGVGESIPPNSVLIFEVELLSVQPHEQGAQPPGAAPAQPPGP
jgi:FKBP-type peptidyl-prolyl cis-trans isomerase FklB